MLAFNGTVKILDFGIARAASFAEEEAKKGLIKGKVSYLSPEQIFVRPFDCRADVFALGVVFHEMLTGRRLFQSRNDLAQDARAAAGADPAAVGDRRQHPARAGPHRDARAGAGSQQTLPEHGRHGGRSGAHADRGALFQPRAGEDVERAVPVHATSRWWSSRRRRSASRRRRSRRPRRCRRWSARPPAARPGLNRGWTARCAPRSRACSGRAGVAASRSCWRRSSSWCWSGPPCWWASAICPRCCS